MPLSVLLHLLPGLPWARWLLWLMTALGMPQPALEWVKVDAPTVIPIQLDELEGEDSTASTPTSTTATLESAGESAAAKSAAARAGLGDAAVADAAEVETARVSDVAVDHGDVDSGGSPTTRDGGEHEGGGDALVASSEDASVEGGADPVLATRAEHDGGPEGDAGVGRATGLLAADAHEAGGVGSAGLGTGAGDAGDGGAGGAGGAGGDAGGGRRAAPRSPHDLAGGLATFKPPSSQVNLSVLVRTDHLRAHPVGAQLGSRLMRIPQWRPFLEGTGLDPIRDFDVIFAFGPHFYETTRISAIIAHNHTDAEMAGIVELIAARARPSSVIAEKDVVARRVTLDGAERVLVVLPGGVLVTPLDGQAQGIALARSMAKKKRRVLDVLPKSDADLLVSFASAKPPNVIATVPPIPADLRDVLATIRSLPDGGASVDVVAKAQDAEKAERDATVIQTIVDGFVPRGLMGALLRRYTEGYTVEPEGDTVRIHHQLDRERLEGAWALLTAGGL